jgi:Nitroreductase family
MPFILLTKLQPTCLRRCSKMAQVFLKPDSDTDSMVRSGEYFLRSTRAKIAADEEDASISYRPPKHWREDWAPQAILGKYSPIASQNAQQVDLSRRTVRHFDPERCPIAEVIWSWQCVLSQNRYGGRSYPSPGRLYPIEVLTVMNDEQVVWFDRSGQPVIISPSGSVWTAIGKSDLAESGAGIASVLCINVPRIARKYLSRGIRYSFLEAGAMAMRLEMLLLGSGIECFWLGGFDDSMLAQSIDHSPDCGLVPILIVGHGIASL